MKLLKVQLENKKEFILPRDSVRTYGLGRSARVEIDFGPKHNPMTRTFAPWYVTITEVRRGRGGRRQPTI